MTHTQPARTYVTRKQNQATRRRCSIRERPKGLLLGGVLAELLLLLGTAELLVDGRLGGCLLLNVLQKVRSNEMHSHIATPAEEPLPLIVVISRLLLQLVLQRHDVPGDALAASRVAQLNLVVGTEELD